MANPFDYITKQEWRFNKLTTAQRVTSLTPLLTTDNIFLVVFDTDLQQYYMWDGAAWVLKDFLASGTGTGDAIIRNFTAGEAISGGMVVMYDAGKIFKFDTSNSANYGKMVGVSNQSAILNDPIDVVLNGVCGQAGGLTPNTVYYASGTPGLLSTTQPATGISQIIGIALNATTILVAPEKPYIKI